MTITIIENEKTPRIFLNLCKTHQGITDDNMDVLIGCFPYISLLFYLQNTSLLISCIAIFKVYCYGDKCGVQSSLFSLKKFFIYFFFLQGKPKNFVLL